MRLLLCVTLAVLVPSLALAQPSEKPKAEAVKAAPVAPAKPAAEPFTFKIERTAPGYEGCAVWGVLKSNVPGRSLKDVSVLLIAYDADGKFLGRTITQASGGESGPADVGYVNECSIDTGKQLPAKVEAKVLAPPSFEGIEVVKSPDKTSADTPLVFQLDKVGSGYGGLTLWGRVTNPTDDVFEDPAVIVTLYGPDGRLLGRGKDSVEPGKVEKGQVGYVDGLSVEVGPFRPAKLEWKVIARSRE